MGKPFCCWGSVGPLDMAGIQTRKYCPSWVRTFRPGTLQVCFALCTRFASHRTCPGMHTTIMGKSHALLICGMSACLWTPIAIPKIEFPIPYSSIANSLFNLPRLVHAYNLMCASVAGLWAGCHCSASCHASNENTPGFEEACFSAITSCNKRDQ